MSPKALEREKNFASRQSFDLWVTDSKWKIAAASPGKDEGCTRSVLRKTKTAAFDF